MLNNPAGNAVTQGDAEWLDLFCLFANGDLEDQLLAFNDQDGCGAGVENALHTLETVGEHDL